MTKPRLISVIASICAALAGGCGDELGECDQVAAEEVVYGRGGLVATKGQALVQDSCGNGAFCHSAGARDGARHGAPRGLDFDMLPSPTGWPDMIRNREAAWDAVREENMPPGDSAEHVVGDGDWRFDVARTEDSARLPAIASSRGKAILRNWLACGAPLVASTHVPDWARPESSTDDSDGGTPAAADWTAIHAEIVAPNCATAGCHNEAAAGGLAMVDACGAYAQLKAKGACGKPRLEPGDGSSLLLEKLESRMPSCGQGMPPAGALPASSVARIRAWVEAGAQAPGCE